MNSFICDCVFTFKEGTYEGLTVLFISKQIFWIAQCKNLQGIYTHQAQWWINGGIVVECCGSTLFRPNIHQISKPCACWVNLPYCMQVIIIIPQVLGLLSFYNGWVPCDKTLILSFPDWFWLGFWTWHHHVQLLKQTHPTSPTAPWTMVNWILQTTWNAHDFLLYVWLCMKKA